MAEYYKGYKIRLYPTKKQEELMWKHIGCCRYVWNWMLNKQQELYEQGEKHLSAYDMIRLLKPLKNNEEYKWLYEVSNASLQIVCRDLQKAYDNFFKKVCGFPKFKKRKQNSLSYPVRGEAFYFIDAKSVKVEKLGKICYKTDFNIPFGIE